MQFQRRVWLAPLALVLGIALAATPARAAEVDKYLPDDTEEVVMVNVKQLLDSGLFKKYGLDPAKQALKDNGDIADILKDLGFDPFTDLDRVVIGSAGGDDPEKVLVIAHGHFDLAKFKAKGEEAAKSNGEHLKIHKRDKGPVIYEVNHPQLDKPMFVALADKNTMLISPGKDYVIDALKKIDATKPTVKNKDIQALIERMDGKQTVSMAMLGSALTKGGDLTGFIPKETLENIDAVGGGLTVGDDVKLEVVVTAKTAEAAKDINKGVNDGLKQALAALALLATQQKELEPVLDIVKSMKTTAKDKTVTLKGEVSGDLVEKMLKSIGAGS
jgi:hypothetical protein